MKIAYIILAHRYPEQLIRLILRLNNNNASFFIHIDKKTPDEIYYQIVNRLNCLQNVYFLKRYRCYWGDFNIVKATIEGIKEVVKGGIDLDYVILLSGQDCLIKKPTEIEKFLEKNKGQEFMEFFDLNSKNMWTEQDGAFQALNRIKYWHFRFRSKHFWLTKKREFPKNYEPYGGSQWWCLSKECVEYINNFIIENLAVVNYFKYVFIPDETFFHTIVLNSPYKDNVINENLTYMDLENPNPYAPAVLGKIYFEQLINSSKLFARKFEMTRDGDILDMIDQKILSLE